MIDVKLKFKAVVEMEVEVDNNFPISDAYKNNFEGFCDSPIGQHMLELPEVSILISD